MTKTLASSLLILGFGLTQIAHAEYVQPRIFHDPFDMQRVVYQLNVGDPETQLKALKYAQNQIDAVGGRSNIELHIVLFDAGVSILQTEDTKINSNIDALRALGVKFAVCNNTLKNKNIDYRTLKDVREVDIVPSGVAEIAFLQRRGYSYMKP